MALCQDLSTSPKNENLKYDSLKVTTQDKLSNFDTSSVIPQILPNVFRSPSLLVDNAKKSNTLVLSPTYEDLSTKEQFFLVSEGLPLWQVVSFISKYYNQNIIVYDDIKDKPIFATVQGGNMKTCLNVLSWLTNSEYIQKDNIYFFGSNSSQILVLPSTDINQSIETIFTNVKARQIEDKLVIVGNQKDVAQIKNSYNQILDRSFCVVHLYAFTVSYDQDIQLGIDINKSIQYAFSWESLALNSYNPMQALAVSLKASLVADENMLNVQSVIDTDIGLISGKDMLFQDGLDWDRPIYSQSQYGEQSQVVSGYSTQHTGLILKLKAYEDGSGQWFVTFGIENSRAESDLKRSLTTLQTVAKLSSASPVQMLAKLEAGETKESFSKGIPFLCDIPVIGYLFRVTEDHSIKKNLYFVLQLKPISKVPKDSFNPDGVLDLNKVNDQFKEMVNKINPEA